MQFTDLKFDDRLQRAVKAAGYTTATPIQEAAIPTLLEGRDLIGSAQTGTGKTAAFVLPILQAMLSHPSKRRRTRALIVTPTRELAEQVHSHIRQLAKYTKITSATVYGGVGMVPQERALRQGADIIVACPGRLLDHMGRGYVDFGSVRWLVLDEADRMLDMGFLPPVRQIVSALPAERQTMLFSATFAPELNALAREVTSEPARIEMGIAAPACTIQHAVCPVDASRKTELLLQLLEETDTDSVLVFTRTKHRADRVARQMERSGFPAAVLHSDRSQSQRQAALDGFRSGKYPLLVATDIAARGIDVAKVSHVINYDVPDDADAYIHRVGRTGRAERDGQALTLVTADDRTAVKAIERTLGQSIKVRRVEGFDYGTPTLGMTGSSQSGGKSLPTSYRSRAGTAGRPGPRPSRGPSRRPGR
jgi:ATP-dependent RNA helicase RhlE